MCVGVSASNGKTVEQPGIDGVACMNGGGVASRLAARRALHEVQLTASESGTYIGTLVVAHFHRGCSLHRDGSHVIVNEQWQENWQALWCLTTGHVRKD